MRGGGGGRLERSVRGTVAIGNDPHTRALKSGELRSAAFDLEFPEIAAVNFIFAPKSRERPRDLGRQSGL